MARKPKSAEYWYYLYEDAHEKLVIDGLSSYSVGGQSFTKNNISFIVEQMNFWRRQMEAEESGSNGTAVVDMSD